MTDMTIVLEWAGFATRWLHVITAIAWIGSSFYFIALDLGLRKSPTLPEGVQGEQWQVHGGGFYHIQKYMRAPAQMPEGLTWFKWESYATWLSGFALLVLVYYLGAGLYLVDSTVLDIPPVAAICLSVLTLFLGWFFYDLVCKSKIAESNTSLLLLLYAALVAVSWGYAHVFSGRAAFIHIGALTATIMSANVFLVIIPNQKIVVADLIAGRTPHASYGTIAKQRSTHNNYLTLPVLFLMLSNHYPLAFATPYNWMIAALVFLIGVTIRHFFNTMHARGDKLWWTWALTAVLFAAIIWLSGLPHTAHNDEADTAAALKKNRFATAPGFDQVVEITATRCAMCHDDEPSWPHITAAPRAVVLGKNEQVARHARQIYLWAGASHAMPPGNVTFMEEKERKVIVDWYKAGQSQQGG